MRVHSALKGLAERWGRARAAERSNSQTYLIELSEALGVERPRPAGSGYEFELPIKVIARDGTEAQNFIDLYKEGHFLLEAKTLARGMTPTSSYGAPSVRPEPTRHTSPGA